MNLMLEVTNRCFLRCPTCFSHQDFREKRDMSFEEFKGIINNNLSLIDSLSLYNYGEPLLNEKLPEMIVYAKKKGISFIKVATNAMPLTLPKAKKIVQSELDCISISLDGATKDSYEKFRIGGQFKKVISGIHRLVKWKNVLRSHLKIEIQFIVMRHNEKEVLAIEELAKTLGVDRLRLKTVLVKEEEWKYLLPLDARYNRYAQKKNNMQCHKPLKELVVNCDGTVIPCCYIVGQDIKKFKMGNAFDRPLKEILNTKKYQNFIKKCTTKKASLSSCIGCEEGNLALDYKIIELSNGQ